MDGTNTCHHLIDVHAYVESRSAQVSELLQVVDNRNLVSGEVTKGPRTAAQRLPRHMRRRAMAYEIRRFPRGIRAFAQSVAVPSKHRKKPPCRFYRRRSRNLLLNYIRRQKRAVWLETHIWHAKRFHMVDRWGYRLPDRSFQRNFRPCYKDSVRHCSIRDRSFLSCFTIETANRSELIILLNSLCNEKVSPTFGFKSGLSGRYEINSLLYEPNQYPKGFIGPVRYLWSKSEQNHVLTIWTHPSCRDRLLSVLCDILKTKKDCAIPEVEETVPMSLDDWKLASMKVRSDSYQSENQCFKIMDLRDQMVRFRLYGPLSMAVFANSIRLVDDVQLELYRESHQQWLEHFSRINIGEIRDSVVFSLLIEDPRIHRISSKKVPWPEACDVEPEEHCTPVGHIWDKHVRLHALEKKLNDSELKKLMGSSVGAVVSTPCKIPIIVIIRNNGTGRASTLTGLEVIAPAGFGPGLWLSLQMSTARASGIRDDMAAHVESYKLHYPTDAVDSTAGAAEMKRIRMEGEEKHSKRPHNRRVDYWRAMSMKHPFAYEFEELVRNWKTTVDDVLPTEKLYVLRDRTSLISIDNWLKGKCAKPVHILESNSDALIPVRVECTSRGKPRKFGLICLPLANDAKKNANAGRCVIVQPPRGSEEEVQKTAAANVDRKVNDNEYWKDIISVDPSKTENPISLKSLFPEEMGERCLKRKILNRTKRENKKRRKTNREEQLRLLNADSKEMDSTPYRMASNRMTIGRIVRGDYSFSNGKGVAIGYVPVVALQQIVSGKCAVLLRNSTSKYYHPGKLEILRNTIEL